MSVVIYHNPRCSKSRQTLALLEENGVQPEVVKYLETPLSVEQLKVLFSQLGFESVREMMRTKEGRLQRSESWRQRCDRRATILCDGRQPKTV